MLPPNSPKRIVSLDFLRGIAVLMVLIVHSPWPEWILSRPAGRLIELGAYGVDRFFVLSGYLISGLLFTELKRTGDIKLKRFWLRRGFKIWPSYYVAYLLAAVVSWRSTNSRWSELLAWPNFVFMQNYLQTDLRWFASWSLAVEEHFYATLPLVLLLLARITWGLRMLMPILLISCVMVPLLRFLAQDTSLIWIQTHLRMDALCWGVLLGYCQHKEIAWPFRFVRDHQAAAALLTVVAILVALIYPYSHKVGHTVGFTLIALCSTAWTAHALGSPDWTIGHHPAIGWLMNTISRIGIYSYTIYLVQQLAKSLIDISKTMPGTSIVMNSHGPQIAVFVGGSILMGWFLSITVERPGLAIRERVVPR